MTSTAKSALLIVFTLAVGFSLGMLADATLARSRRDRVARMGRPPGMVSRLEQVIQPHSPAQSDSIRPVLEQFAAGNDSVIRETSARLKARLDTLRATIAPMLDSAQRARLSTELERRPGPGGGFGGRGRRGGPGRGFPPAP